MSTCSGLAALDYANTKFSRGYAATGVGMGVCARHEFVQPNGVADLQRGERYANMDWIFASILCHLHHLLRKFISYDIACQWGKDLPSTKLSGPGARADQLDDHWHFWNWMKYIGLAALLRRRLERARVELQRQEDVFEEFCSKQEEQVPEWKAAVERFEDEMDKPEPGDVPNPYKATVSSGLSEKEVRARFLEEEEAEKSQGMPSIHRVSPSQFIAFALDLKDEQRRLDINLKKLRRKLNKGIQKLRTLQATYMPSALGHFETLGVAEDVLAENIPLVLPSALPPHLHDTDGCKAGLANLERQSRDAQCREALARLRNHLQIKARFLVYKKHQSRHQRANTRTRTLVARNEAKIKQQSDKYIAARKALCLLAGGADGIGWRRLDAQDIRCLEGADDLSKTEAHRRRRAAMKSRREAELHNAGLTPLDPDADVPGDDARNEDSNEEQEDPASRKAGSGESSRTISWIWTCAGATGEDASLLDALRVEWSKSYARVRRWREEVALLEEEWRRLPLSFAHDEMTWKGRADGVGTGSDPELEERKRAYALKQADMYRDLALRAEHIRTAPPTKRGARKTVPREDFTLEELVPADNQDTRTEEDAGIDGETEGIGEDDSDKDNSSDSEDERGDVDSDAEYVLGSEDED
ncbi:CxC2 domain-containing protein [Mycena kentingensis (nom. inval.)]|nr:CxC2 domain-containing protein [Mycena kentingensis (nom. inval.)]